MLLTLTQTLKKIASIFTVLLLLNTLAFSQTIKGKVTDVDTGEPLVGAMVFIKQTNRTYFVQLDGFFTARDLKPGTYNLSFNLLSYSSQNKQVVVKQSGIEAVSIALIPESNLLATVTVRSNLNADDRNTRSIERKAESIINVVSARAIELSSDVNVATAIQRVSSVTIERSGSGEARYPIIRGMEKRYINTLVNGIKIPSPDNKNRFIPLDLFPSELLERLEISKSITSSMEGDAIGGTINLVMKDAPAKLLFQANYATGYNNIFSGQPYQKFDKSSINKQSPQERNGNTYAATSADFPLTHLNYTEKKNPINTIVGLTIGNRFGAKKQFGFIVSGSYQNIFRGTTSNFFLPNSQPGLNNIPLFSELQLRNYSVQSKRVGLNGKLDYQINKSNKLAFINTFVRLDDYQTRIYNDTIALNSLVDNFQRSTWQYQSINNSTLQGLHKLAPKSTLDWSLAFSTANNHIPDQSQFSHELPNDQSTQDKLLKMTRIWQHNRDNDKSAYLNFTQNAKLFNKDFEVKVGGLYRDKSRDNYYVNYSLSATPGEAFSTINNAVFVFQTAGDATPSPNGINYNLTEDIAAGYVQGKLQASEKFEILGGLRVENTKQNYVTQQPETVNGTRGDISYTDVLPSIQLKYGLKSNQNLRLAYYRALARPGFAELIPDGPDGEFFKEVGNPQGLQHTIADNLDLRYEIYSGNADQILIGAFYKNLQDPIEISAIKPAGINSLYLQPVNTGNATNYGFEAVLTKYFGKFGISANYTYTKSKITNDSLILSSRNSSGQIVSSRVSETRPLQGQSNNIGNVSLLFKDPKLGLNLQAALVYTGERITFISPYLGLNYYQSPTTQLDFSGEIRVVKKLSFYTKINNITNAPFILSLHQSYDNYKQTSGSRPLTLQSDASNKIIIQNDNYKASFLFGLRYKL
jgi:outer membrane receptor protein involved in Fe transport